MMKSGSSRLMAVVVATLAVVGASVAMAAPASASTRLGGMDLGRVCAAQNNDSWWVPTLVAQNAYGWRCYNDKVHQFRSIDLNGGCRILYGGGAWASTSNSASPYAWSCYR